MEILQVEATLISASRQTDEQRYLTNITGAFRDHANAPKNQSGFSN